MKHIVRRLAALTLTLSLSVTAFASSLGEALRQDTLPLTHQSSLTESTYLDENGLIRKEAVVTYTPGETLLPQVVYGSTLYGKTAMDAMEKYPDSWGFSVVAGINGSFFDMANGIPYGCVITGGCVRSSGNLEAVGFRADGSAVIGVPDLSVSLQFPGREAPVEIHVNKVLTKSNGMVLYTRDYDSRTKNTTAAYNIVLQPDTPDLLLGSTLTCTVTDIVADTADCPIPEGGFVLSMAAETDYLTTLETLLMPLVPGDTLPLTISAGEGWLDVDSACAGMEMLVQDGVAAEDFTLSTAKGRNPRTAVGLKEDGSLIFYTVDRADGSVGMTLKELAVRMTELGCVTALNLDGGGSTAIRALYPGMAATQTVNTPDEGTLRKCANFLFLTRPKSEAGEATMLFAYPHNAVALPGGQIPLTVTATDADYVTAAVPEIIAYTAEGGILEEGIFTAQVPGDATVTMESETASGSVTIRVLESPDTITVTAEEGKIPETLISRETLSLTAKATFAADPVYAADTCFVWTSDSAIGVVDEEGLFTANTVYVPTTGVITCTAGETQTQITVTVLPDNPFPDTETHWAKDYVRTMYDAGILRGSDMDGIPHFRPDDNMTRQEFIVSLVRYLGGEPVVTELPFQDTDKIAPWALEAVTTAYATGILTGSQTADGLYCNPTAPITRQEAMVILSRTLPAEEVPTEFTVTTDPGENNTTPDDEFFDEVTETPPAIETPDPLAVFPDADAVAPWAKDGLSRMVELGIISGMSDGTLNPTGSVTRAQVAKMLAVMQTLPT